MANRTAGRHRDTGRRPPSLLTLDYPGARRAYTEFPDTAPLSLEGWQFGTQPFADQPFADQPYGARPYGARSYGEQLTSEQPFSGLPFGGQLPGVQPPGGQPPGGQPSGGRPSGGRRRSRRLSSWRRSFGTSPLLRRRALIVTVAVVLAGAMTAGIVAGIAGQGSPAPHRNTEAATPGIPLPALAPAPTGVPGSRPAKKHTPARHPLATAPNLQPQGAGASQPATAPRVPPSAANRGPAISVRYFVPSESGVGFEGEVVVVNNGPQALSGWQIVVALEGDTVTSVENASGFVSNGILLMQPVAGAPAISPNGGTLRVFFTAEGAQTMPLACAFNGIACG